MNSDPLLVLSRLCDKVAKAAYSLLNDHVLLVHTPKCAGSYLQEQYELAKRWDVIQVGHSRVVRHKVRSRTKIVGLIRNPVDWYVSYLCFVRKSLNARPQDRLNFPTSHPIAVFSSNGDETVDGMLMRMADAKLLDQIIASGVPAVIYGRSLTGVYEFMRNTTVGFWSWTMMYHFAEKPLAEMRTKSDVVAEARSIAKRVQFLHQETIDEDVQRILGIPRRDGPRVNVADRSGYHGMTSQSLATILKMDGDIAGILGSYGGGEMESAALGPLEARTAT